MSTTTLLPALPTTIRDLREHTEALAREVARRLMAQGAISDWRMGGSAVTVPDADDGRPSRAQAGITVITTRTSTPLGVTIDVRRERPEHVAYRVSPAGKYAVLARGVPRARNLFGRVERAVVAAERPTAPPAARQVAAAA